MSRHVFQGERYTLVLGLDAPLMSLFGQIHGAGSPKMLGAGEGFEASPSGLTALLGEASKYEAVPPTVVDALEQDLRSMETGADLSYERRHSSLK